MQFKSAKILALGLFAFSALAANAQENNLNCSSSTAMLSADFPIARMNDCEVLNKTSFKITITPEDEPPINPSPWYAFRVSPHDKTIRVQIAYEHANHRYHPKVSYNRKQWAVLKPKFVKKLSDNLIEITLPADSKPMFVSAQEFISNADYELWLDRLASEPGIEKKLLGVSSDRRSIFKLESLGAAQNKDADTPYFVMVGRQHPPELTGALAMVSFMDTVFGDSALAREFRSIFNVIAVPNMNPDGVSSGNWRHNNRGKDLNRDWGPFDHAETQLMRDELAQFSDTEADKGKSLWFFLDFHSTRKNTLYTQYDDAENFMPGFTAAWIGNVKEQLGDIYPFTRDPRHNSSLPTSKNYVYTKYGISAITYEVGDETDRSEINRSAIVFAEEMMKELLKQHRDGAKAPYDE
ncbi:succinylglutamate desuccinylase/aspartoacylase family protein [Kordiimonas sp. SCSIO 12603]|uniref:M14 family metallopeptidase n=1 Tax=Kordiimonas sp. SCSIO 12603 TaxID=2829596 RepID=UPI0021028635|nr:M14 family metallopeptidase [Kordiimonas sp. SCSIO 12603]UTW58779.1 succinylglutamate desuccinylase/aspartoacylase family protein [Kordiimonas sp. SCSIO 12603]